MFRAMKAEPDGLPKVGRSRHELGVRIDGPIRDLPVGEDGMVELKQEACRWRLILHRTCRSRVFPDPLGEKAGIPYSRCDGQRYLKL
jgi:hypothetical protein